jgi:hypothetical protein
MDSFTSPIPGFKSDDPILVILISARTPSTVLDDDSLIGPSAGSSKIWAGKPKVTATLLLRRNLGSSWARKLREGSRSMTQFLSHPLHQLLLKAHGACSPCASLTGILSTNLPSFSSCILAWFLCRALQDIEPDAPAKDCQLGGESSKVDKSLTLDDAKMAPKTSEPPSLNGTQSSPDPVSTSDPTTKMTPNRVWLMRLIGLSRPSPPKITPPKPPVSRTRFF